ncbi:MAG: Rha family transcriptional regulator [Eubacteriales bacterium]|nr:Rha family transcriptional regulator [Eubacteriales bacterium]
MRQISLLNKETLDSREVAEMIGKQHSHLLRDIASYEDYLIQSNFGLNDYFQESSFTDAIGRKLKNYQITKKGCEFLAHKLTGAKGAAFTAKYIDAFHEMKESLAFPSEVITQMLQVQAKMLERLEQLENRKPVAIGYGGTTDEIESLLNRQRRSRKTGKARQLLMETLPPEIRIIVDRLLLDKSRNYTFVQKVLAEKGYRVSDSAIRNYYRKTIAKTEVTR